MGTIQDESLQLKEIRRFPNPIIEMNGRLHWDLLHQYQQIITSLQEVESEHLPIMSLGIDTWGGVDFVCFGKDGEPLRMPYSYRDNHTFGAPEHFSQKYQKKRCTERRGYKLWTLILSFN